MVSAVACMYLCITFVFLKVRSLERHMDRLVKFTIELVRHCIRCVMTRAFSVDSGEYQNALVALQS
jgi:hypothetical protein